MSMSTHVIGFKPPDEKWAAMKRVWEACATANVPIPNEVLKFFQHGSPDDNGVRVEQSTLEGSGVLKRYKDDMYSGFELNVAELVRLDPTVKLVRFYNSW